VPEAIRDAIDRRYDMIHYMYTNFYLMSKTAEPLMRTMWNEFPDDEKMYKVDS